MPSKVNQSSQRILRGKFLELIASNIEKYGWHVYVVQQGNCPRYIYTIGLTKKIGFEIIMAGCSIYQLDHAVGLVNDFAKMAIENAGNLQSNVELDGKEYGIGLCHESWSNRLMLGYLDYYGSSSVSALQMCPPPSDWTLDTPDLTAPWDSVSQPVWQWLELPWSLPVPTSATVATSISVLRGRKVTEISRWSTDEWEMFSDLDADLSEDNMRVIPFGTAYASDNTIKPAILLHIKSGIYRNDAESPWKSWRKEE